MNTNYEEKWNQLQKKLERALDDSKEREYNSFTTNSQTIYRSKIEILESILWIMADMINPIDQKEYGEIR